MAKSKKIYIVLRRGYEYNDEIYECQEGGNTIIGYEKLEHAEYKKNELLKQFVRVTPEVIFDYYYWKRVLNINEYNIQKIIDDCNIPVDSDTLISYIEYFNYDKIVELLTKKMKPEDMLHFMNNYVNKDRLPFFIEEVEIEKV